MTTFKILWKQQQNGATGKRFRYHYKDRSSHSVFTFSAFLILSLLGHFRFPVFFPYGLPRNQVSAADDENGSLYNF